MSEERTFPTANGQLRVVIDDDVAQGVYSNLQMVSSSDAEFVIDFLYLPPTRERARVRSRAILNPRRAKALHQMLAQQLAAYEARFGEIPPPPVPPKADGGGILN